MVSGVLSLSFSDAKCGASAGGPGTAGTTVITGGLGGLGSLVAAAAAGSGGHLLLLGRSGRVSTSNASLQVGRLVGWAFPCSAAPGSPRSNSAVETPSPTWTCLVDLTQAVMDGDCQVTMARCDVAVATEAAAALACHTAAPAVRSVIHAGMVLIQSHLEDIVDSRSKVPRFRPGSCPGTLSAGTCIFTTLAEGDSQNDSTPTPAGGLAQDALLAKQSAASVRAVLAPKAAGTLRMAAACHGAPLAGCAYFSSVAALLGNASQANYAAANAALDAAAARQQAQVSVESGFFFPESKTSRGVALLFCRFVGG